MPEFSIECRHCSRLARHLARVRAGFPGYHARPVAPFGATRPRLLIVGLEPGVRGANRTGRPFTGDFAGVLLYETLHRFGFANRPGSVECGDGLRLIGCRITNAVKCLPPENKPTTGEVRRCKGYLRDEILGLPGGAAILALGGIAHRAVLLAVDARAASYPFRHGERHVLPSGYVLYDSYHCSRYNTQTKRLTPGMFQAVFDAIGRDLRSAR